MVARAHMHRLVAMLALVALIAPLWLGPALDPLVRALGAEREHTCACGMVPGKCDCPECADEQQPHADPICKSGCNGSPSLSLPDAIHACVLPAPFALRGASPSSRAAPRCAAELVPLDANAPPTPPPRSSRV
jgi:hypothetical protein